MDARLQEILLDYGLEGYGLYWYCLELIAANVSLHNLTFELEHDSRVIARNTGSTIQKVQEMMNRFVELGLFENSAGTISCIKLAKRLDQSMTGNPDMRNVIKALNDKDKPNCSNSHDSVMKDHARLDKIRLEKKREEDGASAFPDGLDIENWKKWIAFRRAAKYKKYKTDSAMNNLASYTKDVQQKAVKHSMDNEYQGLFPEKFSRQEKEQPKPAAYKPMKKAKQIERADPDKARQVLSDAMKNIRRVPQ